MPKFPHSTVFLGTSAKNDFSSSCDRQTENNAVNLTCSPSFSPIVDGSVIF